MRLGLMSPPVVQFLMDRGSCLEWVQIVWAKSNSTNHRTSLWVPIGVTYTNNILQGELLRKSTFSNAINPIYYDYVVMGK